VLVTGGLLLAALGTDRLDAPLGIGRGFGPTAELYLVAVDGPGRARLTDEPGVLHWGPAWSPDGRTLAYTVARPPAPGELVLADPDGGRRRPLAAGRAFGYLPAWSPDGARLAFIAQAGGDTTTAELAVVDADGGHLRRLTANAAQEYGASWSPDGRRLAFGSKQDGSWRVYVLDADGAEGAEGAARRPAHGRAGLRAVAASWATPATTPRMKWANAAPARSPASCATARPSAASRRAAGSSRRK
jgi:dipeptidyl aminopeptidase/acylaminoacyl peptidase